MEIRKLSIGDYEEVYALWRSTPGMGLNDIDDSKDGIARYLARNPNTLWLLTRTKSSGRYCPATTAAAGMFTTPWWRNPSRTKA